MRTNIEIDDNLLEEAMKVAGTKTKKATVEFALQQLVAPEHRKLLLDLPGTVRFSPEFLEEHERRDAAYEEYKQSRGHRQVEAG